MGRSRYPRDVHVLVGVPTHGATWPVPFATSLMRLVSKVAQYPVEGVRSIRLSTNVVSGSMLAHNRETLVRNAIKKEADYVLFLDSDMRFPADTLAHLMRWKRPFVAAQGVTKEFPATPCAMLENDERLLTGERERGLRAVRHVGLAVALIEVESLIRMSEPRFLQEYVPDADAPMGEDVYFCRKWKDEVRKDILVDIGLSWQIGHIGTKIYDMSDVRVENTAQEKVA